MRKLLLLIVPVSVSAALAGYGLFWLDNIVNGALYNYGLQFSYEWYTPFWSVLRTVVVLIGLTATFSVVSYLYMYRTYTLVKRRNYEVTIGRTDVKAGLKREKKPFSLPSSPTPTSSSIQSTRELEPEPVSVSGDAERANGSVRCNHCNRVFSQPLRMLDFQGELPRMIDVCPFCSEVIRPAVNKEDTDKKKKLTFLNGRMNSE